MHRSAFAIEPLKFAVGQGREKINGRVTRATEDSRVRSKALGVLAGSNGHCRPSSRNPPLPASGIGDSELPSPGRHRLEAAVFATQRRP
jgi:hypothetical protein